jgi:hypothetical protein
MAEKSPNSWIAPDAREGEEKDRDSWPAPAAREGDMYVIFEIVRSLNKGTSALE